MISLNALHYTYPEQSIPALNGVDLEVGAGEFVLLAGRSGCGKSTLLRAINGLVPHFSGGQIKGSVNVADQNVVTAGPRVMSRLVGFLFQNPEAQAVVERVEAEIAFGLEQIGLPAAEIGARIESVLTQLELQPLRRRQMHTLSGGERQRVALASILAQRPQILLLDEPTSQLDPAAATLLLDQVRVLHRDLGLTVLIAEHRLDRLLPYADRLIYMADGKIEIDGPAGQSIREMPYRPPLVEVGLAHGWEPLPLTINEAKPFVAQIKSLWREDEGSGTVRRPAGADNVLVPAGLPTVPAEAPMTPILALNDLAVGYDIPLVSSINLSLYPGELLALLGRNGAGKSAMLRTIVNLLPKLGGEIQLNGRSTVGMATAEICREVAYLPQNPDDLLYADTVWEEPAITLRYHDRPIDRSAIDQLLDRLGLSTLAERYPRDLSVGQRLRVALAAVLITRPRVVILDEPTRGLDALAKRELIELWRSLLAEGIAILLVTHDVELVAQTADRVAILRDGALGPVGPAAEILPHTPPFQPQMARLFEQAGVLTVEEVLRNESR